MTAGVPTGFVVRCAPAGTWRVMARPFRTTPQAVRESNPFDRGHITAVYAGRIDNRDDLVAQLSPPAGAASGDGELFAEAYAHWGRGFARHVVGEYSVCVIDRRDDRVVAARDSLGLGRLFVHETDDGCWLASNLELLLSSIGALPALDRESLAGYFAGGGLLSSGRTIYKGINEVPPAHAVVLCDGRAERIRYWQPNRDRVIRFRDDEECDDACRSILADAVAASLRSSLPLVADLSGGLDSSTVAAVAHPLAARASTPLTAFSLVATETPLSDESAFQDAFLEKFPMPQVKVDIDRHVPFSSAALAAACHPSKAALYGPLWLATKTALGREPVAQLTGRGGDSVFCGDGFPPLHLAELVRTGRVLTWSREMRLWLREGKRSLANLVWQCSRSNLTDLYAGAVGREFPSWFKPSFADSVRAAEAQGWRGGERTFDSPARELQFRSITQTAAVARHIPLGDERHPLLFRPLVEFALALPWRHLLQPKLDRVVQRRIMRGVLPETVRLRRSKSSGTSVLLRGLREHWRTARPLAQAHHLAELDLVDRAAFAAACERLRHGLLAGQFPYLAAGLSLEIWLAHRSAWRPDHDFASHFSAKELRLSISPPVVLPAGASVTS